MSAFRLAAKWKLVPVFKPDPADDKKLYREKHRAALEAMGKAFGGRIGAMRRPPRPGPKPGVLVPPPLPEVTGNDAADRAEAARWGREVNDPWLDEVYFPQEAERVIWQIAADVRREWEAARNARRIERADWIRSWAPLVLYVGGAAGILVIAFVFAWSNCGG